MEWRASRESMLRLSPLWPAGCAATSATPGPGDEAMLAVRFELACEGRLAGSTIGVAGLADAGTPVLVRATFASGRTAQAVLAPEAPHATLPAETDAAAVFRAFFALGAEHLAIGIDHLLFVAGLVWLVPGRRRLAGAVTAFTLGHSVTLGLATLGVVHVPALPVELAIAASLVAVAVEIARGASGRAAGPLARRPATLALAFGLVHGLGFAGSLSAAGLAPGDVPLALFGFNLGVEAAQLAFVLLLVLAAAPAARLLPSLSARAPRLASDAVGGVGVFLILERVAGALGR